MTIPALSLWQPWASIVALGEKRIETCHFDVMKKPGFRPGPIAIHAAQKWSSDLAYMCMDTSFFYPVLKRNWFPVPDEPKIFLNWQEMDRLKRFMPLGKILCVVDAIESVSRLRSSARSIRKRKRSATTGRDVMASCSGRYSKRLIRPSRGRVTR